MVDRLGDVRDGDVLLRLVDCDEDVARDTDLLERIDLAVEHDRGAGGERVVLVPLEVGREERREQDEAEHDARVARGDRPAAVHRLGGAACEGPLGERRQRQA